MGTVPFTVRLDSDLRKMLDREAKEVDRTASYVAAKAIANYLQGREKKKKAINEAVKLADKGVFVSEKAVNAWVDSWGSDNELPKPKADIFSN